MLVTLRDQRVINKINIQGMVFQPEGDNEVYLGTLPWIQAGGEDRS